MKEDLLAPRFYFISARMLHVRIIYSRVSGYITGSYGPVLRRVSMGLADTIHRGHLHRTFWTMCGQIQVSGRVLYRAPGCDSGAVLQTGLLHHWLRSGGVIIWTRSVRGGGGGEGGGGVGEGEGDGGGGEGEGDGHLLRLPARLRHPVLLPLPGPRTSTPLSPRHRASLASETKGFK